jgi:hypothetical protein
MAMTFENRQILNRNSQKLLKELSDQDLILYRGNIITDNADGSPRELLMQFDIRITDTTVGILEKYRIITGV